MPKESYTDKSMRHLTLQYIMDEGGIFEICNKLHMSFTGASDPLDKTTESLFTYHLLVKIRDFWTPAVGPNKEYDDAVYQLITATLNERYIGINPLPTFTHKKIVTPDENNSGSHTACLVAIGDNENKRCLYEEGHTYPHMTEAEYDANPGELG